MKKKNKNKCLFYPLILVGFVLIFINSCKKNDDNNSSNTITDIDGNVYHTVTIGTQVWMVENLKTTKYRNGDPIPNVTDYSQWDTLTTGAYCNSYNDASNVTTYGRLYNWYAVNDSRNIAPTGWHVPSNDEWKTLTTYLGGESIAGGKLKEKGTTHWNSPNTGATNETGFTALPAGSRFSRGIFDIIGYHCYLWSTTMFSTDYVWSRSLDNNSSNVSSGGSIKELGLSVRCLRD